MKRTVVSFALSIAVLPIAVMASSCSANSCIAPSQWEVEVRNSIPSGLVDPKGLESLLVQFLRAQCTCEFSEELVSKITTGVDVNGPAVRRVDPDACIGLTKLLNIAVGDEKQIAVIVSPYDSSEEYSVVMFYSEKGWLTYWPEMPGLHP